MNFNIQNLYTTSQLVESQTLCFNWTINIQYQFIAMSHIIATLQAQPIYCQKQNTTDELYQWVNSGNRAKPSFAGTEKFAVIKILRLVGANIYIVSQDLHSFWKYVECPPCHRSCARNGFSCLCVVLCL